MIRNIVGRAAAAAIATGLACAGPPASVVVLQNVTIIPGTGAPPITNAVVVIEDRVIAAVGPAGTVSVPSGARTLALDGRYVVPGFIDTHAHLRGPRVADTTGQVAGVITFDPDIMERTLRLMLSFGVTAFRNPSTGTEEGVRWRDALARGEIVGPRMVTAGHAIDLAPAMLNITDVVEDEAGVRAAVRRQHEAGVDLIKVFFKLPRPLTRAAVDEAHALGLPVMGHLGATTWQEAALDGIDFLTHTTPFSAEFLPVGARATFREHPNPLIWWELVDLDDPAIAELIAVMASTGVRYDPNLVADEGDYWGDDVRLTGDPDLQFVPTPIRDEWERRTASGSSQARARGRAIWPKVLTFVRRIHEAGVPISASTDMPNSWVIPGKSLLRELELLTAAGFTPGEALTAASLHGAEALGLADRLGTIQPGRLADLVVLQANPLTDISNARSIAYVILGGHIFDPDELRR